MGRTRLRRDGIPRRAGTLFLPILCLSNGFILIQYAFENLEEGAKDGIVPELLGQDTAVFGEVAKSQWGSYCIQHSTSFALLITPRSDERSLVLEHGSDKHRQMALDHLLAGLLEFATNEQGNKSVVKALKEGGKETLDRVVQRMCEPAKGYVPSSTRSSFFPFTFVLMVPQRSSCDDRGSRSVAYGEQIGRAHV